jgi:two-component system, NtrC family, sensor histidine kinase KinB
VSPESQAIYLNAVPLLALGALYLVAAAALAPNVWRERGRIRDLELTLALVFPSGGLAAVVFGLAVLAEPDPVGGNAWLGLAAVLLAAVPVVVYFLQWKDRALLLTGSRRAQEAEARQSLQERQRETTAELATALGHARGAEEVATLVVEAATRVLGVDFAAVALVEEEVARGLVARLDGEDVPWFGDLRVDLRHEPSAIASAAFEAAPLVVYDVESSPVVSRRIAERVGARSAAFVPLVADAEVVAVLVAATTRELRAFSADDVALLGELAAEAALAFARARSAEALGGALERERLVTRISRQVRSERDLHALLDVAVTETGRALGVSRCFIRLGRPGEPLPIAAEWTAEGVEPVGDRADRLPASNLAVRDARTVAIGDVESAPDLDDESLGGRETLLELGTHAVLATPMVVFEETIGAFALHRTEAEQWSRGEVALAEAVAREVGLALHTARLLTENERRLKEQSALLEAAQAVAGELELEPVLQRFVDEVAQLLGGEAADCYLLDGRRGVLRCAAVHGLPAELVGWEFPAGDGVSARAIESRRAVRIDDYEGLPDPVRHPGYAGFKDAIVAPVIWAGEVRGVLGVGSRRRDAFGDEAPDVLEAFASLASLALRNAEAYGESVRQARVESGFYRIATVLGQPLSRAETFDAVAQAASDALGGTFAAVLIPRRAGFELAGAQSLPSPLEQALGHDLDADGPLAAAATTGRIVAVRDAAADTRFGEVWRELAARAGYSSLLAIPIGGAGEPASGLVLVFFADTREFSDEDLELAGHLAGAARGALERSELYEEERMARTLAQQLARTGGLLATELDPAAVVDEVVVQAPQLVGADACAIRVVEGDELVVTAAEGTGTHAAVGSRSLATGWLSGDVIQRRAPLALEDAAGDERLAAADPILGAGYAAFLGVPLGAHDGAVNGVLAVYARRPRAWRDEEVEALQALAGNASAALANAELYQRVALERERSFAILANIADGIVAADRDGRVVLWNRAAEKITGVPQEEAVGHTPLQVLGRDLQTEGPAPTGDRLVSILRGGEEVWLSVTEAVMRDPSGAVAGRIYAFRDISADRLVEQMKSDFVSTVSQELRRPLTSIYGFAETLLRRDVLFGEDERAIFLGYIASESERLTEIVDALLNVARLDTGDLQVNLASVEVGPVVSDVVGSFEDGDELHDFVLDLPDEAVTAEADPDKLRQVLSVLVDNAIKYSPQGGTVTVAAQRRDDAVELSVADEGIGIPAAEQDRIFRKFYRGDAPASREATAGGTGLGLFIAQGLVSAMGGRIWVTSSEGEGSRFAFELPLAVEAVVSEPVGERV